MIVSVRNFLLAVMSIAMASPVRQFDAFTREQIRRAKESVGTEISFKVPGNGADASLAERLNGASVMILTERRRVVMTSVVPFEGLFTWHLFEIEAVIHGTQAKPTSAACSGQRYNERVQSNEIAIEFPGGRQVIDGVTVSFTSDFVYDAVGTPRYVALVNRCSSTAGSVMGGGGSWAGLTGDGRLIVRHTSMPAERELQQLGTLAHLEEWLATQ
jgi:hypothetical protein